MWQPYIVNHWMYFDYKTHIWSLKRYSVDSSRKVQWIMPYVLPWGSCSVSLPWRPWSSNSRSRSSIITQQKMGASEMVYPCISPVFWQTHVDVEWSDPRKFRKGRCKWWNSSISRDAMPSRGELFGAILAERRAQPGRTLVPIAAINGHICIAASWRHNLQSSGACTL